jgi:tetratricopeptide (TPR) repeat protein
MNFSFTIKTRKCLLKGILQSFFFILFFSGASLGSLPEGMAARLFETGNKAYEQGLYDSAVSCYTQILQNGIRNAEVYYNLGNAYFRMNRIGLAMLNFEKAKMIRPDDEDIEANIKFAAASLVDKIPEPQIGFFGNVLLKLNSLLTLNQTTLMVSILFFLICFCMIFGVFASYNGRLIAIYSGVILFVFFLASGGSLAFKINGYENVKYAVVLSPTIDALNEPDGSQVLFSVHEGIKFEIRKHLSDWVLISLPNGMTGWTRSKDLGEIE